MTAAPVQIPSHAAIRPGARGAWRLLLRIEVLGLVFLGLAGIALLFVSDPAAAAWLPRCFFHDVTGLHCPGCGATRALHALVRGDVLAALQFNALLVALVIGLPLWPLLRRRVSARVQARLAWTAVVLFTAFLVLRNLPITAFLAPPA